MGVREDKEKDEETVIDGVLGHPRARLSPGQAAHECLLPGASMPSACTIPWEQSYKQTPTSQSRKTLANIQKLYLLA